MRTKLLALVGAVLLSAMGAGTAAASDGPAQTAGQVASNLQGAASGAISHQVAPTNSNIDVRVLSPGSNGSVSQSNSSSAASSAHNSNGTDQSVAQDATGGTGAVQTAGQLAHNAQLAASGAASVQRSPVNRNLSVRVLSPGRDGDVSQSNDSTASSRASNHNHTDQSVDQSAGGGSGAVQSAGQIAGNAQAAFSGALSAQDHPTNRNIGVRVLSPGSDGSVDQTNDSRARSDASNRNGTHQDVGQDAGYSRSGASPVQAAGQFAASRQAALSFAGSFQDHASNVNLPVRIFSPGGGGSVRQSNSSAADSRASNHNTTTQGVGQAAGGGLTSLYGAYPVQAAGQFAANRQLALSGALSAQLYPSNRNLPIRIGSYGGGGSVDQSNDSSARSSASNANRLFQEVMQQL